MIKVICYRQLLLITEMKSLSVVDGAPCGQEKETIKCSERIVHQLETSGEVPFSWSVINSSQGFECDAASSLLFDEEDSQISWVCGDVTKETK